MEKASELLQNFLESPRSVKRLITLLFDFLAIFVSMGLALWLNSLGGDFVWSGKDVAVFLSTALFSTVVFIKIGFYRAILRYIAIRTVYTLLIGITLSTLIYILFTRVIKGEHFVNAYVYYWALLTCSIGGARLTFKGIIDKVNTNISRVAIYGAGAAGRQLASALSQANRYSPVCFFDNDENLAKTEISGMKVYSPDKVGECVKKYGLTHVFLAIPSASHAQRNQILNSLEPYSVKVKTIPGLEDIVSGTASIEQLQDIEIEDLLGRDPVAPSHELLEKCITNKVVMVTGAGGSIGSELCRQIIELRPKSLVLFEVSEFALYRIERELKKTINQKQLEVELFALLGSVQNRSRLRNCMSTLGVQTVYHAAAYKHVPIVEHNIIEGIRNNVFGTLNAAQAALESKVENFVLISTDKAVRPTNIMGASKRMAELVLQAMNEKYSNITLSMVRFGNVLGSSGSVVPLFREQIKRGGPVTVTHPDIVRYFMSIPEAAQLVIQAGSMGRGGDVYVLDMGEPVKIVSLAQKMIRLMGYSVKSESNPQGEISIEFTGLRPGEKLYEELLVGENVEGTDHPRIMMANEEYITWEEMKLALKKLDEACSSMNCDQIVKLLLELPTGYNPQHEIYDTLWQLREVEAQSADKVVKLNTLV